MADSLTSSGFTKMSSYPTGHFFLLVGWGPAEYGAQRHLVATLRPGAWPLTGRPEAAGTGHLPAPRACPVWEPPGGTPLADLPVFTLRFYQSVQSPK